MINLPKPSQLRTKGTPDDKINYIITYLTTLVSSLERALGGSSTKQEQKDVAVKDVSVANGKLVVIYNDGSEKKINL